MTQASNRHSAMVIQCVQTDFYMISLIREMANVFHYRVYSGNLGCFLPADLALDDLSQLVIKEKTTKVFNTKGYKPLFNFRNTYLYFAQLLSDNSIHIINPGILKYIDPSSFCLHLS